MISLKARETLQWQKSAQLHFCSSFHGSSKIKGSKKSPQIKFMSWTMTSTAYTHLALFFSFSNQSWLVRSNSLVFSEHSPSYEGGQRLNAASANSDHWVYRYNKSIGHYSNKVFDADSEFNLDLSGCPRGNGAFDRKETHNSTLKCFHWREHRKAHAAFISSYKYTLSIHFSWVSVYCYGVPGVLLLENQRGKV